MNYFLRSLLTLTLLVVQFTHAVQISFAQNDPNRQSSSNNDELAARIGAIERAVEEKRVAFGIPGLSLAIVKDDKVIFSKGFGSRDLEKNLPVTPETFFNIGSSTKAFTAMAMMMSADEGKLSLDDSPKKFLPYFKLRDAEADSKVTLRDLLSHRTGLDRTDLSFQFANRLTREDVIKIAGLAKPTARLGEKWQYQNTMFTAVGEASAKANNTTWEKLVAAKIFKPLGMNQTNTSSIELQKMKNFSFGYDYNPETKETRKLKITDTDPIAPAGAINSNVVEMSQWLRLMLGGGMFEGKRLVSEKNYNELTKEQIAIMPGHGYGFGWFLDDWHGKKEVNHGGNNEGYSAMVSMIPEEHLGFVMLSNVSFSPLQDSIREIVYSNLLGAAKNESEVKVVSSDLERETGKYYLEQVGMTIEVTLKNGKLVITSPQQPDATLENVGGRRYKLVEAAGVFATFRPVKGNESETEMYLEQPAGSAVFSKLKSEISANNSSASTISPALKEIVGDYESVKSGKTINITARDNAAYFQLEGKPPLKIVDNGTGKFTIEGLPEGFFLTAERDNAGKVNNLLFNQNGIVANLRRQIPLAVDTEDLMNKMIEAQGGAANLRKHVSMRMETAINMEGEGMTAEGIVIAKAPNLSASSQKFFALGKEVGETFEYFDGENGGTTITSGKQLVAAPLVKSGSILQDARIGADFYQPLDWKTLYQKIVVKKMSKIDGEDVYVVEKTPIGGGHPVTEYVSQKTFLVLRRESFIPAGYYGMTVPYYENFSDYRLEDGIMMPHKIVAGIPHAGASETIVKSVRFNAPIPDSMFRPALAAK